MRKFFFLFLRKHVVNYMCVG